MNKIEHERLTVKEVNYPYSAPLFNAYQNNFSHVSTFFSYNPHERSSIKNRLAELSKREFPREAIASIISDFHNPWGLSTEQELQLQKLKQANSVVVIGGQQAGLLTGPLYTYHKAISIIVSAAQAESEYNIPVVPIFWIAGEDHDFLEINHTYVPQEKQSQVVKHSVPEVESEKRFSVAQRKLNKAVLSEWLDSYFSQLPQTEFTADLKAEIISKLEAADDYVSFFSGLINHLFKEHGLLLINSADQRLREIETEAFKEIIEADELIHNEIKDSIKKMDDRSREIDAVEVLAQAPQPRAGPRRVFRCHSIREQRAHAACWTAAFAAGGIRQHLAIAAARQQRLQFIACELIASEIIQVPLHVEARCHGLQTGIVQSPAGQLHIADTDRDATVELREAARGARGSAMFPLLSRTDCASLSSRLSL